MNEQPPNEYQRFVIEDVRRTGETLTLVYGGHVFGGIVRCLLDPHGVEDALQPGTEIFVRYHNEETGAPGQVARIIRCSPIFRACSLSDRALFSRDEARAQEHPAFYATGEGGGAKRRLARHQVKGASCHVPRRLEEERPHFAHRR